MNVEARSWLQWGERELAFLGKVESRHECERMLESLLKIPRLELYRLTEYPTEYFSQFAVWVRARKRRIPLAYLLKRTFFWEDEFKVEEGVFLPRPETEILVEAFHKDSGFQPEETIHVLDLGTGSGILAITLAKLFPQVKFTGSDLSGKALTLARRNAFRHGVHERLRCVRSDGLFGFEKHTFDAIVCNPPYISSDEIEQLDPEIHQEPRLALDGGKDGLEVYRKILSALSCLKPRGSLWFEVGYGQAGEVERLLKKKGFRDVRQYKDLNQIPRVVAGVKFHG